MTIEKYLKDELWTEKYIYDAGHILMVPLHAAFLNNQFEWGNQFAEHFQRFVDAYPEKIDGGRLNRLHYFYLLSRFLVLASQSEKAYLIPNQLPQIVFKEVERLWEKEPAWQWGREPFSGGIRERVLWKLKERQPEWSYYRAIIDEELFLFAIAADLRIYGKLNNKYFSDETLIGDILDTAYKVFQQEIVWREDGGWLFQPGVWSEHPDYAYAGQKEKIPGMEPLPVENIATDSSHSHRFPLWLTSLANAYPIGSTEYEFYEKLKQGLEIQLFNKVLVPPSEDFPSWRMNNFMDGSNGVYRWGYITKGEGRGYGPYELSGTLLLGWWSFLESSRIKEVYLDLSNRFPLPEEVVNCYVGPNTTRERHLLVTLPGFYRNGMAELIVRLASEIQ